MGFKDNGNDSETETQLTRRKFLKKAAYTAPALVALGQLAPRNASAIGPPVSQPGNNSIGAPPTPALGAPPGPSTGG